MARYDGLAPRLTDAVKHVKHCAQQLGHDDDLSAEVVAHRYRSAKVHNDDVLAAAQDEVATMAVDLKCTMHDLVLLDKARAVLRAQITTLNGGEPFDTQFDHPLLINLQNIEQALTASIQLQTLQADRHVGRM